MSHNINRWSSADSFEVTTIIDWKQPKSVSEVRNFHGLAYGIIGDSFRISLLLQFCNLFNK